MTPKFTPEQLDRYARHIILPEVGGKGQRRLLESRAFVVGAGGLGSPALLYLAAAGVGTIDVIDSDVVEASNLQRQVIHTTDRVGQPKAESARTAIAALNPDVKVIVHNERLTTENVREKIANADVVIDGCDNFGTRYLVNEAAVELGKPLVYGAVSRFDGQAAVFPNDGAPESPCYQCVFPEAPPPGLVPTCREAGIFGVVPGIIGMIQATEAIKLLLGLGETLAGRMLIFDARTMKFREMKLKRNPACKLHEI